MATTPINVVADRRAVKYTGTNSAEIAALIDDFTVTAETATLLTFTSNAVSYTVPVGGWITYWEGAVREDTFANDDDFRDVYRDAIVDHYHELVLKTGGAEPLEA
jgi:hypothetical protein